MHSLKKATLLLALTSIAALPSTAFTYTDYNDQLDDGIDLYDDHRYENATEALQTLVDTKALRRLDSTEKSLALSHLAYSLMQQGKPKKALPSSKALLSHSKYAFGKESEEYVSALYLRARVLYRIGKSADAIRTVNEIASTLERMGPDYSEELNDAKSVPSQIRRKDWNKENLPKDLSDFYTKCESIHSGDKLPVATRTMHEYKLVGKDYKPARKLANKFKNTYIKRARENSKDRANRIIFIPDEKHLDDWCVIYPDGKLVDRAVIVPPED